MKPRRQTCEECGRRRRILVETEITPDCKMNICVECLDVPPQYRPKAKLILLGKKPGARKIQGASVAKKWEDE